MSTARSALQIAASRRNGARSRGPRTAAGKAHSAQNALRHGLASRTVVLVHEEDRAAYEALRADIIARHRPKGALEEHWAQRLCDALWRQARLDLLEARALDGLIAGEESGGLPGLATLARYRARIARDIREARAELEALREARIHEAARATANDPARLRALAAILEGRRAERPDGTAAAQGTHGPRADRDTNEPGPLADATPPAEAAVPRDTNEPGTASRGANARAASARRHHRHPPRPPAGASPASATHEPAVGPASARAPHAAGRPDDPRETAVCGRTRRNEAGAAAPVRDEATAVRGAATRPNMNEPGTTAPRHPGGAAEAPAHAAPAGGTDEPGNGATIAG